MNGKGTVTEVSITGNPDYLSRLRLIVGCHGDCAGLNGREVYDAKLAITEACANAIRHGSADGDSDRILVRLSSNGGAMVAEVSDSGDGFNLSDLHPRSLDQPGGLGIPLMQQLTDEVEFVQDSEGMTVRLVKRARRPHRFRRERISGTNRV